MLFPATSLRMHMYINSIHTRLRNRNNHLSLSLPQTMASTSPLHLPLSLLSLLLLLLLTSTLTASPSPSPSPSQPPTAAGPTGCSAELVAFSPCLPFVASSPNNISSSPSSDCCTIFSSAFDAGATSCLCYLVRRNTFFGFPLNSTRLFSLSSLCPLANAGSNANGSLQSLCSGSIVD